MAVVRCLNLLVNQEDADVQEDADRQALISVVTFVHICIQYLFKTAIYFKINDPAHCTIPERVVEQDSARQMDSIQFKTK